MLEEEVGPADSCWPPEYPATPPPPRPDKEYLLIIKLLEMKLFHEWRRYVCLS